MICTPCKRGDHWNCPDVVRANVVRTRNSNPSPRTGREPTQQNGWLPHVTATALAGDCDCAHCAGSALVVRAA